MNDMIPLPRSSSFQHVSENLSIEDVELDEEDVLLFAFIFIR